ncbi:hypothetical protein [Rubrolithibacter danxiaensis]|uniref:hypothetical protein n=1 Tax=Rubrolithibacter danxiaensis TaxID=3390805 RepID=UPI003BF790E4
MDEGKYRYWPFINYIFLALAGVLLRWMQLYGLSGFNYQNLLHAHSHFAFSGWVFLSLLILLSKAVTNEKLSASVKPMVALTLICSFGMLVSFSVQGYKLVSILFSTLFIAVTYWFSWWFLRKSSYKEKLNPLSVKLIRAAIGYLCLSSIGPFALGPLMANGFRDTPVYQNAIYFYLHFQMNGWMLLAVLGIVAQHHVDFDFKKKNTFNTWLAIFIYSPVPLYVLFTLWSGPSVWVFVMAFITAILNLLSWLKLCFYFKDSFRKKSLLINAAVLAITVKGFFQLLICFPAIGEWTFSNRNLIIGYIHLLTLGCISPVLIQQLVKNYIPGIRLKFAYIAMVLVYLMLLFLQPLLALFSIGIPQYPHFLLCVSVLLMFIGGMFLLKTRRRF